MGNFTVTYPYNFVNGTTADANEVNANFDAVGDGHNDAIHATTGHGHTGATGDGPKLTSTGLDLTAAYTWTGVHTFDAAELTVKGAGAGKAALQHANSASNRTYTFSDATGNVPSLPTAATTETGSGAIVRGTSPTITTPTIASFTNAQHDHTNAAGGGTLSTSAIASGTFANARISQGSVTQHEAALTILETQITDGSVLARVAADESITGDWLFPVADPPTANRITRHSLVKTWAQVTDTGGLNSGNFNISSAAKNATGDYTVVNDTAYTATASQAPTALPSDTDRFLTFTCTATDLNIYSTSVSTGLAADSGFVISSPGFQ